MSELLQAFGNQIGILPEYLNYDDSQRVVTSDETYRAILQAMGFPIDETSLRTALESLESPVQRSGFKESSARCVGVEERTGKRQARGVWVNLYTIRSATNWGVGDFGDLRRLVQWAAELGLDFVAFNPLHALRNRGDDVSPYRPVSRLYRNEVYLEMEAIPEFDPTWKEVSEHRFERDEVRAGTTVDYGKVAYLKRKFLESVYRVFKDVHGDGKTERGMDYLRFIQRGGKALRDFATFQSQPDERTRAEMRDQRTSDVGFHCFVQFELNRQLAAIANLARDSGMSIGLMGDLAIGTAPDGSDPWAYPDLFVKGVSIGAPPDDLGPQGQNWALPPMNPRVLAESDFAYWRTLLRNNLAHMGALRIDHVMGLLRQFWIPDGFDGSKGAYVQFPAEQLFGILAEESRRSGAVIIGEDLGTVPEGFRDLLARFGVLSTRVVHFERNWDGQYKPASDYPTNAYTVVETHDMVPLAGFAEGRDLHLRRKVGLIPDDESLQEDLSRRRDEWNQLKTRLGQEGYQLESGPGEVSSVGRGLDAFLFQSPCAMVALALDDLAGEREPVNVPGVGQDRHASWSRRMTMTLEEIVQSPAIAARVHPRSWNSTT